MKIIRSEPGKIFVGENNIEESYYIFLRFKKQSSWKYGKINAL